MNSNYSAPPGMSDIMPAEMASWHKIEDLARSLFPLYGFSEARTPLLEYLEVFSHGLGTETDVVQKEMYKLVDRGGRTLALRPEGTAGMIRALSETDISPVNEKRVYYIGPMFRGERPAAGRRRQFHQVGVENAGRVHPELDAECILMLMDFVSRAGIEGHSLLVNTRSNREDRKPAEEFLKKHFADKLPSLCEDCRARFEKNIWRILDCKNPECAKLISDLPDLISYFGAPSREYFEKVCILLEKLKVPFKVDPRLVRGLDYYEHTVFELTHPGLGGQNAIAGGGRYRLVPPGTNKEIPGIGFAAGLERLIMSMKGEELAKPAPIDAYIVPLCQDAVEKCLVIADELRKSGFGAVSECECKSMKSALRGANRISAKFAVILGENELAKSEVLCKNMSDGSQSGVSLVNICQHIKEQLKGSA